MIIVIIAAAFIVFLILMYGLGALIGLAIVARRARLERRARRAGVIE